MGRSELALYSMSSELIQHFEGRKMGVSAILGTSQAQGDDQARMVANRLRVCHRQSVTLPSPKEILLSGIRNRSKKPFARSSCSPHSPWVFFRPKGLFLRHSAWLTICSAWLL